MRRTPSWLTRAPGPRAQQEAQKVTLLALKTTAITYDFEEAAEQGDWLWGITNTVITNTISSDYLRGLNVTMAHDLFEDQPWAAGEGGGGSGPEVRSPPVIPELRVFPGWWIPPLPASWDPPGCRG